MTELGCGNVRYSEAVRQLEGLLELERETLSVKRKVSAFTVDYDDDLVMTDKFKLCRVTSHLILIENIGFRSKAFVFEST